MMALIGAHIDPPEINLLARVDENPGHPTAYYLDRCRDEYWEFMTEDGEICHVPYSYNSYYAQRHNLWMPSQLLVDSEDVIRVTKYQKSYFHKHPESTLSRVAVANSYSMNILEKRGYVEKRKNGRYMGAYITDRGRKILRRWEIYQELLDRDTWDRASEADKARWLFIAEQMNTPPRISDIRRGDEPDIKLNWYQEVYGNILEENMALFYGDDMD